MKILTSITSDHLSIVLSLIAIGVSISVFYFDMLQAFNLKVYPSGRITLSRDTRNFTQDVLFVDFIFSNHGAKRGVVGDIALVLNNKHLLQSFIVQLDRKINFGKELPPPILEPFVSFELGKNESVVKKIGFVSDTKDFVFKENNYVVDVWVFNGKKEIWEKTGSTKFSVTKEDLDIIHNITRQSFTDGSSYVKMNTQDKISEYVEKNLRLLKETALQK